MVSQAMTGVAWFDPAIFVDGANVSEWNGWGVDAGNSAQPKPGLQHATDCR